MDTKTDTEIELERQVERRAARFRELDKKLRETSMLTIAEFYEMKSLREFVSLAQRILVVH